MSDFDPLGTGGEHSEEVRFAIDGNPGTSWTTETYTTDNFGKEGVGITWTPGSRLPPPTSKCARLRAGGTCRSTALAEDLPPDDIEG